MFCVIAASDRAVRSSVTRVTGRRRRPDSVSPQRYTGRAAHLVESSSGNYATAASRRSRRHPRPQASRLRAPASFGQDRPGGRFDRASPSQPASRMSSAASAAAVCSGARPPRTAPGICSTPGPIGLEVDPGHEPVAEQERQHVIAVDPLGRRHVDLDPVVETEQPLGAVAMPDDRVEGLTRAAAETRRGAEHRDAIRHALGPVHLDRDQLPRLDQLAEAAR